MVSRLSLVALLLALVPLACGGEGEGKNKPVVKDKEPTAQDEIKALEGFWKPVAAEQGGQKAPEETLLFMKLVLAGDRYTVTVNEVIDKGTIKVDPAKKPKTMDITGTDGPNKGKTLLAIYELKGDSLRICYDMSEKSRPAELATKKDTQLFLVTYQRIKDKTGTVQGRVHFKGRPLAEGVVSFHPEKGKPLSGKIEVDGSYLVKDLPPGKLRITVAGERLPKEYRDPKTSGIEIEVDPGKNEFTIELK